MLIGGFEVGRVFGFRIRIDASWFLVFALVIWTFSQHEFPRQLPGYSTTVYYTMGAIGGVLFFLSVLLHELAHSVMARARGIEVEGITLFIFGGVAQTRMEAQRALDEFLLTIVGPLMSVALAGVFYLVAQASGELGWPAPIATVASFLALLNFVLAVFNMVPAFPLDGGRIFRSAVWAVTGNLEKATRWATWGGRLFGYLLIAFGVLQLFYGYMLAGLWSAFIGWFVSNAASSSYRQFAVRQILSKVPAASIMVRNPVVIGPETTVKELIDGYLIRGGDSAYPVVSNGGVLGLVGVNDVARIPEAMRSTTTVGAVMRSASEITVVRGTETLDRVVGRLGSDEEHVLVVEDGRFVGVLGLGDIGGWVKRARELGFE